MDDLKQAALDGNTKLLLHLHKQDPLLLDRITAGFAPSDTPIHVASLKGHTLFAKQLLTLCPGLAGALDSRGSLPLHYAAAKGHGDIVREILRVNPDTCTTVDREGLNPLHLAAANGRVEVVAVLVGIRPDTALAKTRGGETVLHLCAKYGQIECLKKLMFCLIGLINDGDDYGYTALHVAVAEKQTEVVRALTEIRELDVNATNANGHTALDILTQSRRGLQDWDIGQLLQQAGATRTNINHIANCSNSVNGSHTTYKHTSSSVNGSSNPRMPSFLSSNSGQNNLNQGEWLAKKRDALMIVAILLATMAFQAGVTPPGGVWGSGGVFPDTGANYRAGEAVVAYNYPQTYKYYLRANTISFVASLSTILLLISGLPIRRRLFMWILMMIMWLSITSMAFTYAFAIVAVTPKKDRSSLRRTMYVAVPSWCGIMMILLLGHTVRLIARWLKKTRGIDIWKPFRRFSRSNVNGSANGDPSVMIPVFGPAA